MRRFIALLTFSALSLAAATARADDTIRATLLDMGREDQAALRDKALTEQQTAGIFKKHTAALKTIVREHSWPRLSEVGAEASQAAWLLVQHADDDRAWQQEALQLMEPLVASGEIQGANVAYLKDRLSVAANEPQPYGTQGACGSTGVWVPFAMRDPEQVDRRRATMKMQPLQEYVDMATRYMCKKADKK